MKALERLNRLKVLLGDNLHWSLIDEWTKLEQLRIGVPHSYHAIVSEIEHLSVWQVNQPAFMLPLYQRRKAPPGTTKQYVDMLTRFERSLADYVTAIQARGGSAA